MTIPGDLVQKLGPNFDYGALERALATTEGQALPENVKTHMRAAIQAGRSQRQVNPLMPSDATREATRGPGDITKVPGQIANAYLAGVKKDLTLGMAAPTQFFHDLTVGLVDAPDIPTEYKQ